MDTNAAYFKEAESWTNQAHPHNTFPTKTGAVHHGMNQPKNWTCTLLSQKQSPAPYILSSKASKVTQLDLMKIIWNSLASTQVSSCPSLKQQQASCSGAVAPHKPAEGGGASTHLATSVYHPQQVFIGIKGTPTGRNGEKELLNLILLVSATEQSLNHNMTQCCHSYCSCHWQKKKSPSEPVC